MDVVDRAAVDREDARHFQDLPGREDSALRLELHRAELRVQKERVGKLGADQGELAFVRALDATEVRMIARQVRPKTLAREFGEANDVPFDFDFGRGNRRCDPLAGRRFSER